jgi:hypothetical protein
MPSPTINCRTPGTTTSSNAAVNVVSCGAQLTAITVRTVHATVHPWHLGDELTGREANIDMPPAAAAIDLAVSAP